MEQSDEAVRTGDTETQVPAIGHFQARQITRSEGCCRLVSLVLAFAAYLFPYVVIAVLTAFEKRASTLSQRAWILSWLVSGQVVGLVDHT